MIVVYLKVQSGIGIMERRYLLGNGEMAGACFESPVDFVCGYPGTPSSEVVDILRGRQERHYYTEWSVNEKVALENALGAAWCGIRAVMHDETCRAERHCRPVDDQQLYWCDRWSCDHECG